MQFNRRIGAALSTFLLTFAAGYVAFNADALASRFGGAESATPMRLDTSVSVIRVARVLPASDGVSLPLEPTVKQLPRPATQLYELRLPEDSAEPR